MTENPFEQIVITVYEPATGIIDRVVECQRNQIDVQCEGTESYIMGKYMNDQYTVDSEGNPIPI